MYVIVQQITTHNEKSFLSEAGRTVRLSICRWRGTELGTENFGKIVVVGNTTVNGNQARLSS